MDNGGRIMKIAIVSDIHGNYDAWRAFKEEYDELWVLGDLVNYGPQPQEVMVEVMEKAAVVVQGNHDNAVANDDDSKWTARYRELSTATRTYTSSVIRPDQKAYLANLPSHTIVEREGKLFYMTHASPSDPLYGKCLPDDEEWVSEFQKLPADILLVGHTHVPFIRKIGDKILLNPGSIGQPRTGNSLASYAVYENGEFELRLFQYPVDVTVEKLNRLALPKHIITKLTEILETGHVRR